MRKIRTLRTTEATAVLLFFLQSVRVLFSVLFGLIYDTIFQETVSMALAAGILLAVVAAFLAPLLASPRRGERLLTLAALVAALARLPMTFNLPTLRLWSSVVVVAAGGLYAASLARHAGRQLPTALVLALLADQFLRSAGNTYDLSLRTWWWPVQTALTAGVALLAWRIRAQGEMQEEEALRRFGLIDGLSIGALLFLQTSLLNFPNGVARWSGVGYELVAPLLIVATMLPLLPQARRAATRFLRGPLGGLALVFLTLAGVALGRVGSGGPGLLGLMLAQALLLTVLFRSGGANDRGRPGLALALGQLLFLVLNFAFAFAFTYPYTIPAFEGLGLPVTLVAVLFATLPALRRFSPPEQGDRPTVMAWLSSAAGLVLLVVVFAWPRGLDRRETVPLRVATYNIHYGYDSAWRFTLEEMARAIEESGADVLMMQEVDACRITSYGVDDALWLARRLGMHAVYQPTLEGLSGIALLSRYPLSASGGSLLPSQLEQTGIVHARLQLEEGPVDAYGIWLGLAADERARQLTGALSVIGEASPVLLGGDFNATPDSPVYSRLAGAGFVDPFLALGREPRPTSPSVAPQERIDFVWGRGLAPTSATVLESLASDHRMVVTEWTWP